MATGYIVWDSKNRVLVSGPFLASADATKFVLRNSRNTDSRNDDKSSKDQSKQFTVETVTLA